MEIEEEGVVFAAGTVHLLMQVVRNRGLRGAMFGAPVARTLGEVELKRRGMVRLAVRVHVLEAAREGAPAVGIELSNKSATGVGFMPIPLTSEQARTLASMLSVAAAESARV